MSDTKFNLDEIASYIRLVETHGLAELIVDAGGCEVSIRGLGHPVERPTAATAAETAAAEVAAAEAEARDGLLSLCSPMIGVFYRSPGPDQPPFVEVGDHVKVGQTIGLIEAMKVFSEIPSEHAGRVVEIPAKSGDLLAAGDTMLLLEASDDAPAPSDESGPGIGE